MRFRDREDAGRRLACELGAYARRDDVRVLGLPRGGVPVAYEIATALGASLDVLVVRKLGLPNHEEYAMGAIANGDIVILDDELIASMGVSPYAVKSVITAESAELERRQKSYRPGMAPPDLAGNTVILVDDGLATGCTMRAAIASVKMSAPAFLVIAVPIASEEACEAIRPKVDQLVCLSTPWPFRAVGIWYENFSQTSDQEVRTLLDAARRR